jgi:hypothetical protein
MSAWEASLALALRAAFIARFYVAPLWMRPSLHTLACCLAATFTGSL